MAKGSRMHFRITVPPIYYVNHAIDAHIRSLLPKVIAFTSVAIASLS
jgi:hypothetical protein